PVEAVPHPGLRRQMDDQADLRMPAERGKERRPVRDIAVVESEILVQKKPRQPRLLQGYIIIGIEVIHPHHAAAVRQQRFGDMHPDETRRPCHQNGHHMPLLNEPVSAFPLNPPTSFKCQREIGQLCDLTFYMSVLLTYFAFHDIFLILSPERLFQWGSGDNDAEQCNTRGQIYTGGRARLSDRHPGAGPSAADAESARCGGRAEYRGLYLGLSR